MGRGRGRAAGYDDQREAILERAAFLFAKRGYASTSMNQVADACGLSKATLYHYFRDKYALLVSIADGHVSHLEAVVRDVMSQPLEPEARLRALIRGVLEEYADAQDAHRVLTEDVRFLEPDDQERVLGKERWVVRSFAEVVVQVRPELKAAALGKPLTMFLFGMINWMFTWMKPGRELDYDDLAPVVADLFVGGLAAVTVPRKTLSETR
jgi:TetR/AcrR family transcriptional regulator